MRRHDGSSGGIPQRSWVQRLPIISGQRGDHSHAWLRADGVIVDITADQFDDMPESIIVAPRSPWHGTFEQRDMGEAGFRDWQPRLVQFERAYAAILKICK
jgi:hypothetical protein